MRSFKQKVSDSFDKGCEDYDSNSKLQKDILNELLNLLVEELEDKKNLKTLLELGSGTGESVRLFLKKFSLKEIHLIDISRKMIEKSKKKIDHKCVSFEQKDFDTFENFKDFDLIFSNMSIHWSNDVLKLFSRIVRSMKKNAFLIISFPNSKSFQNLPSYQRNLINKFPDTEDFIKILDTEKISFKSKEIYHNQKFVNFFEFLKNLKIIGANISNKKQQVSEIFGLRKEKKKVTISFNISYIFLKKITD